MLDPTSSPTARRLAMRAHGYSPLPLNGKAPKIASWQKRAGATEHEIAAWARSRPAETNTGLLTRNNPAFDVDILSSAEVADAVADLISEELRDRGALMVRFGRKPKRAIVCRTDEPFKKIKVELDSFFTDPETGEIKHDAIEILGDGQQLACFGEHPDTGQSYEWAGGSPADVPASDLPLITEADARVIIDKVVAMLGERFGIKPRCEPKAAGPDTPVAEAKTTDTTTAWGGAALRSACEMIAGAGSGSQEETLNRECYGIGQLVAGGQLPEAEALRALLAAAAAMPDYDPARPWTPRAIRSKVRRSFADGKSKPRAAPEGEPVEFLLRPATVAAPEAEEAALIDPTDVMRMLIGAREKALELADPDDDEDAAWLARGRQEIAAFSEGVASARERFPADTFGRHFITAAVGVMDKLDVARELNATVEAAHVAAWLGEAIRALEQSPKVAPEPEAAQVDEAAPSPTRRVRVRFGDFVAYMPSHQYIYKPTREMWLAGSVDSSLPKVKVGFDKKTMKDIEIRASHWIDRNHPVAQMTWAPGKPMLIEDHLVADGGWIEHLGATVFNLYRPPLTTSGDASQAGRWLDHVRRVYPESADHIVRWLAFKVQHPGVKVNHALVLGGKQGIGKDTILEPVKQAVGSWNFQEVKPTQMLGRFNDFLKKVVLRISEARDLGDSDRYAFYEHTKDIIAAPPDVLRVDEKHLREYTVFNVVGVVLTTNHKTGGIYLPPDDRRHYVAWSDLNRTDFDADYFNSIYKWFADGGSGRAAAYLRTLDLAGFDPKAPPPQTDAFWEMVVSGRAPEDAPMADALDRLGNPDAVTLKQIEANADADLALWLRDRRNSRAMPHRLEECGYVAARNSNAKDGLWKIQGARQAVYARHALSAQERAVAAAALVRWCSA